MNIVVTTIIYRNNFQKPTLFFSTQNFSIGSIILVPFLNKDKPAIVLSSENLKNQKFFLRKNKLEINKITNDFEKSFLKEDDIKTIKNLSEKFKIPMEESILKIIPKKTRGELNKIYSKTKDFDFIKKFTKKISSDYIKDKLTPKLKIKKVQKNKTGMKSIDSILLQNRVVKKTLHSEKHYLVEEIRNYFGERAKKGKGSFGFYLGFFKRIPERIIYQYWSEVKQSNKSIMNQQKLFWWKIGVYLKENKNIDKNNEAM